MTASSRCAFVSLTLVLGSALCAYAQLRPEVTVKPKPKKPPAAKVTPKPAEKPAAKPEQPPKPPEPEPAQIIIETSPNAQVHLDDQFAGRAGPEGRLVIANPKPGAHRLRVSLAGKKNFQQALDVTAGQETKVAAALTDLPGRILVRSLAGAEVFLDNSSRGVVDTTGQLVIEPVAPGHYEVRISAPGKTDYRQTITVLTGQETTIQSAPGDIVRGPAGDQTGQSSAHPEPPNPVAPAVAASFRVKCMSFLWLERGGLMTIDKAAVRYESYDKKNSLVFPFAEIFAGRQYSGVFEIQLKNGKNYIFKSTDSGWSADAIIRAINRAIGRQ